MAQHSALISWNHSSGDFLRGTYSREHSWTFDGGIVVAASSSPSVVPVPYSNPANVDPEEAFIAAISSCHMLSFLYEASKRGFEVSAYEDHASGKMGKNERGAIWVSAVQLTPRITYGGERRPSPTEEGELHHAAHEQCFIANSVKTEITVAPPA